MKPIQTIVLLLVYISCSSVAKIGSYSFVETGDKCEGSTFTIDEQVANFQKSASNSGYNCFTVPVQLKNKETLTRAVCSDEVHELLPIKNFTRTKKDCELAKKLVSVNPDAGLQGYASQEKMEERGEGLWIVDVEHMSCLEAGKDLEDLVTEFKKTAKGDCEAMKPVNTPAGALRIFQCGQKKSPKMWIVSEGEMLCQRFLETYERTKNSNVYL